MTGTALNQNSNMVYANLNLKVGSFNIRGQNKKNEIKLRKINKLFAKNKLDILLLQETRSDGSEKEKKKWQNIFNTKQVFLSKFGSNAVGCGIVIKNEDIFKVQQEFVDPLGRYVAVIGDHEEGRFLILSFYAPSTESEIKQFIEELGEQLSKLGAQMPEFVIAGGDTNTVLSHLDKQGGSDKFKHKAMHAINDFKNRFDLFEPTIT